MIDNVSIREYKASDKDTILAMLRMNTPAFFSPEEESDLVHYLENEIERYFVIEFKGEIAGSGGFNLWYYGTTGVISWDILHPDFQGKGLGTLLLNHRIERLRNMKNVQTIMVRTTQLAYGFYERNGFSLVETADDYWAKGFHLYRMEYTR